MKRTTPLLMLCASAAIGCTQLEDSRIESRQRRMARAAYVNSPGACNGTVHSVDYAHGFEEGYYDVASGGDGCPPPLPPKKYWRATYNSPLGQEHVKAWFQGFRDGAAAAKADGVSSFGSIYIPEEHLRHLSSEQPQNQPLAPQAMSPVPSTGANVLPVLPPQSSTNPLAPAPELKKPMSEAPPLRDPQAPPPRPPSALGRENDVPPPMTMSANPMAPVLPASGSAPNATPIPTLKMPEFELPEGFTPDADLGEPRAAGSR